MTKSSNHSNNLYILDEIKNMPHKKCEVAALFLSIEIANASPPGKDAWCSWEELENKTKKIVLRDAPSDVLWAKDYDGNIFLVFAFRGDENLYNVKTHKIENNISHLAKRVETSE